MDDTVRLVSDPKAVTAFLNDCEVARRQHGAGVFRSLINEAIANFHDYIGQTVYGQEWVNRAQAALKEHP